MWIVCKIGFFNIVCQDGDAAKGLLTVKGRSREDMQALEEFMPINNIEESDEADYRYRAKIPKREVRGGFATLLNEIDYPKTKPKLMERNPDRLNIYFNVWDELCAIQDLDET